ncbi:aminoglycoside phosphotransferase family protein [Streptomyces sp. NPDC057747]|uniref:aminoglycoside phosphotransferase family protein n=1 Tax=Streptomyces sp. NPDC057747 TaxID=3346238 RepID=UPI0036D01616
MTDVTRAIAAATSVAASLDLPANDAIVLHNSNKLALRLMPCDVFARVAPVGQEVAQFEVDLAQRLTEVGCPVCPLEPRADPRVHTRDGFAVTLWTYYEPVTPHTSPVDYAKALELLHAGMREVDVPSPRFTDRITEAEEVVADPDRSPELTDADRVFLSGRLASLRRAIDDRGGGGGGGHRGAQEGKGVREEKGAVFFSPQKGCLGAP